MNVTTVTTEITLKAKVVTVSIDGKHLVTRIEVEGDGEKQVIASDNFGVIFADKVLGKLKFEAKL